MSFVRAFTLVRVCAMVALLLAPVSGAMAQRVGDVRLVSPRAPVGAPAVKRARTPGELPAARGATVLVNAAPGSFQVIAVEVPAELASARQVHFAVENAAGLVSARTGTLDPVAGTRRLLLTFRLSAEAAAGRTPVADVVFTAGAKSVVTSLEVNVAATPRTLVTAARAYHGARTGQRVELLFMVQNTGNGPDTLEVSVEAPEGWRAQRNRRGPLVLRAGEVSREIVTVSVPGGVASGEAVVLLVARARGIERARGQSTVAVAQQVAEQRQSLVALASATTIRDERGSARQGGSISLRGALTAALSIDARFAARSAAPFDGERSIALLPYEALNNQVTLTSARWTLQGGAAATPATELTGQYATATGGAVQFAGEHVRVRALAGKPLRASLDRSGGAQLLLAGADYDRKLGGVSLTATRMENAGWHDGRLDAAALGAWMTPVRNLRVAGEVAERRFEGGRGIGASGSASYTRPGTDATVRISHAPGGAAAYATARDALFLNATHSFGARASISADGWSSADSSGGIASRTSGWSVQPSVWVTRWLELGVDARDTHMEHGDSTGATATAERQLGGRARAWLGPMRLSSQVINSTGTRGGVVSAMTVADARRLILRNEVAYDGSVGVLNVASSNEIATAGVPVQRTVALRVERLRPLSALPGVTLDGGIERVMYAGTAVDNARGGVTVALAGGTRLVFGVQQDGLVRMAGGAASRPVVSLRVERSTGFTMPDATQRGAGLVFQDMNGNGVRDRGEQGFAGIVLRRGGESAVTDANGRFRLSRSDVARTDATPIVIDQRSLPTGWLAPQRANEVGSLEIPVVPTGTVEVTVRLRTDSAAGAVAVRLGAVALVLRDDAGRTWTARTAAGGRVQFDALPLGRYELRGEADEASEPLVIGARELVLTASESRWAIEVEATRRPIRVFQRGARAAAGGGR